MGMALIQHLSLFCAAPAQIYGYCGLSAQIYSHSPAAGLYSSNIHRKTLRFLLIV